MFSKLKSLFTQQVAGNPEEQTKFDHSKLSGDAKECPFMKGTMKGQYEKHNKDHKNGADSDSEEDTKQTSGCPMMGGSERKKNPKLAISNSGYD